MSALWTSDEVARALSIAAIAQPFETDGVTFDSRAVAKGVQAELEDLAAWLGLDTIEP